MTILRHSVRLAAAAAVAAAGLGALALPAVAGTTWRTSTYRASTPSGSTPGSSSTSSIVVAARPDGRIAHLVVGVRLTTPSARALTLTLAGPGVSKPVLLVSPAPQSVTTPDGADIGSGSPDCTGTLGVFDDASTAYFGDLVPPIVGNVHATSDVALTSFLGVPASGTWTLSAHGVAPVAIDCWTMRMTREVSANGPLLAVPDLIGANVNTLFKKAASGPWSSFKLVFDCHPLRYPITIAQNRRSDVVRTQSPAPGKRVAPRTRLKLSFDSSDWQVVNKTSCYASGKAADG